MMKTRRMAAVAVSMAAIATWGGEDSGSCVRRLSVADYRDRMMGAWLGKSAGVAYGWPTEFRYNGVLVPDEKMPVWTANAVNETFAQDDLYVQLGFIRTLAERGLDVSSREAGLDFANTRYRVWCGNFNGRNNIRRGIAPPYSSHPAFHPSTDDLDYEIECDYSGIIAPGMPQVAVRMGNVFGRLMNYADGVYAGQFIGAMYAEAFFLGERIDVVESALRYIPSDSGYAEMVRGVTADWRRDPRDWKGAWKNAVDAWFNEERAGRVSFPAVGCKLNGAMVLIGFLFGDGDFERTMRIATQCGFDSDCNPSTACGLLGALKGARAIPERYVAGLSRTNTWEYVGYTFPQLVDVCETLARKMAVAEGGSVVRDGKGNEILCLPRRSPAPAPLQSAAAPEPALDVGLTPRETDEIRYEPDYGEGVQSSPKGQARVRRIEAGGELRTRIERNFDRLEETKYRPENVFLTMEQSWGWPGDTEGRTILGLVLDAQATGREPKYLDEILRLFPSKLNDCGYFGPVWTNAVNEQQISGMGWVLRGLCAHYRWKRDPKTLEWIRTIADNLFLPAAEDFANYPIDPATRIRNAGGASGNTANKVGRWELSTDVGCYMIGIDGLIDARMTLGDAKYDPLIEKAIARYLEIDQVAIRAQAHATLTGIRALLRYGTRYLAEAEERFRRYRANCMTETYANANWFTRFETFTEPCAIVDSYMVALQLWTLTGKFDYLELADRIYWNGICRAQRRNGGFGLETCPMASAPDLRVHAPEAHWCCTMRGAEGLSAAAGAIVRAQGNVLTFAQYHTATVEVETAVGTVRLREETDYPLDGKVRVTVLSAPDRELVLRFFAPSYLKADKVSKTGFVVRRGTFRAGDVVEIPFALCEGALPANCAANADKGLVRRFRGPLLVNATNSAQTVWHRLSDGLWEKGSGACRVLGTSLREGFACPPKASRPGVWFHIIGGNASKAGITKDIEAIAGAGLRSVHFFHEQVGAPTNWPGVTEPTPCLSKGWYGLVDHLSSECRRLGVEFNMQNCPGWATTGGPWITASNAMRIVVFSRTDCAGGKVVAPPLPKEANDRAERDYRDIACLAFPTPEGDTGDAYEPTKVVREGDSYRYEFDRPVTVRSVELSTPARYSATESIAPPFAFTIVAEDGGRECASVGAPRSSWFDDTGFTIAIPPTTSRKWRIDVRHDHPIHKFSARFHSSAKLDNWEGAAGLYFRSVIRRPYPAQPASCWIPEGSVREIPLAGETVLPPGKWTVLRVGHVNLMRKNLPAPDEATGWECSKFDRQGVETHVRSFIDPLLKGPLAGGKLHGVLIDSWECLRQTWGYCLEEKFAKSSSFRLREWLPAVFGWVIGDPEKTRAFLRDWTDVRGRLVEENYYRRFVELMHERGLEATYETAFGDVIAGDPLRYWKWADVPTCEFWRPHNGEFVYGFELKPVRPCASAVHVYGKDRVAAEATTSFILTFDETLQEIKRVTDLHFGRGITYPIFQAYTHKPEVGGKGPGSSYGAAIGTPYLREQTWWPYMRDLAGYMARCSFMLESGKPVVDILRYLGDDFDHRPKEPEVQTGVEARYKIDYLNGDVLDSRLDVKDGRFVLPDGMSYSVLWLPDDLFLTEAHVARIAALERKGGKVVRGDIDGGLAAAGVAPDVLADGPLDWYHRRTDDADVWFVAADTNGYSGSVSLRLRDGTRAVRTLKLADSESAFLLKDGDGWAELDPATGAKRFVPATGGKASGLETWDIEFPGRRLAGQSLRAWKDLPGSADDKAFSGTATYRARFEADGVGPLTLDLGRVRDYAEVRVNGKKVRRLWCAPYACDIGPFVKKGVNELRIDVTSSWYNRLAADAAKPESERVTWTLFGPEAGSPLHESGLLGPVKLVRSPK